MKAELRDCQSHHQEVTLVVVATPHILVISCFLFKDL